MENNIGVVRVRNLVLHIKGRAQIEAVWERGDEEIIWTQEVWRERRMEKVAQWGAS
jgi:hypothetical protein